MPEQTVTDADRPPLIHTADDDADVGDDAKVSELAYHDRDAKVSEQTVTDRDHDRDAIELDATTQPPPPRCPKCQSLPELAYHDRPTTMPELAIVSYAHTYAHHAHHALHATRATHITRHAGKY